MNEAWYVIHTKPRKERQVAEYLQAQDIEIYFPTSKIKPVNPRASKIRPYFPRYIFVKADIEEIGISALRWVPNAVGLVMFGNELHPIPESIINQLKQSIDNIQDAGGINLANLNKGDVVKITHGSFAGYEAIFDTRSNASDRVLVLLDLLGSQVKAQVAANAVVKK